MQRAAANHQRLLQQLPRVVVRLEKRTCKHRQLADRRAERERNRAMKRTWIKRERNVKKKKRGKMVTMRKVMPINDNDNNSNNNDKNNNKRSIVTNSTHKQKE